MIEWEKRFEKRLMEQDLGNDPAHDLAHFRRVVQTAKELAQKESASLEVILPAAWFHDLVNVPKNDPRRSQASRLSAESALQYLREVEYPTTRWDEIGHAIEAHSYSAQIEPKTLEAKVVQDADRLDGLGAIGIARVFSVGGLLKRTIYEPLDPWAQDRTLNDLQFTVDHFFVKLFRTVETLRTPAGREEGQRRASYMRDYLKQLGHEIGHPGLS